MKSFLIRLSMTLFALSSGNLFADTLVLKDGQTLNGTLISRSADGVLFEISGQQLKFDSSKVQSISFGGTASSASTEKTVTNASEVSKPEFAPVGTRFVVKTSNAINSRQHKQGHKFTTRLEADIVSNNVVIVPRGATVYAVITQAKQSGRATGSTLLEIAFTDILLNNQMVPIQTTGVKAVTESTTKSTASRAARLAAVGGLANGSKGAKNAAKVGLGVSILSSGNSINIPAGTLLEFQLAAPLSKNKD